MPGWRAGPTWGGVEPQGWPGDRCGRRWGRGALGRLLRRLGLSPLLQPSGVDSAVLLLRLRAALLRRLLRSAGRGLFGPVLLRAIRELHHSAALSGVA